MIENPKLSTQYDLPVPSIPSLVLLAFAAILGACYEGADEIPPAEQNARVEEVFTGLGPAIQFEGEPPVRFSIQERLEHYNVPGVSVAFLDGDTLAWTATFGVGSADSDGGAGWVISPATLFQAASISKPVAALAALSLVEEGLLDLDAPVNDYLTSWSIPDNEFTTDSVVTLRGLLTHSAGTTVWGFPGYRKDEAFSPSQAVATNAQVLDGEGNTDPVRVYKVPGTSWQYSGGGFTIMEQMVEDVTGEPFHEVAADRVLSPAGMAHSTYEVPLPESRWSEAAHGHDGDGSPVEGEWHNYPEQAAAALWTTAEDLARLSQHLNGILKGTVSGGVVSREILEAMLTPNHPGDEAFQNWGLGIGLQGEERDAVYSHGGSNAGFKALWFTYRNRGQGFAVMTNGDRGSALAAEIARSISYVYGWPDYKSEIRPRISWDADALAPYVGEFLLEGMDGFAITIRAGDGVLEVAVPGQGTMTLHPAGAQGDEFYDPVDADYIRFDRDESGVVVGGSNRAGNRFSRR